MNLLTDIVAAALASIPLLLTLGLVTLMLALAHFLLIRRNRDLGNERLFSRQLIMLALTLIGLVAVILALPVSEGARNQIIALLGLLISGVFAFSSSNIFANLAAGVLLRMTRPFVLGDFISVGEHFGRVAERGLFDTEIQSESGELIALPNSYLTSRPIATLRSDGALVSAELSLGYDAHHADIEPLLLAAAKASGLQDAFVQLLELGNFAISYRVSGVLPEARGLITARSNLYKAILDGLHGAGIEIMSPTIMNQRPVPAEQVFIPAGGGHRQRRAQAAEVEAVLFDKAELAQQLAERKAQLSEQARALEEEAKGADAERKAAIKAQLERMREQRRELDAMTESGGEAAGAGQAGRS